MDRTAARRAANRPLLDEMAAGRRWFHARKTRPIWVKQLTAAQRVNTLEGEEDVPAGTFLCRGEAGDLWPQAQERLEAKYEAAGEPDTDGWRKYVPRPDNEGVMAAQVDHEFAIEAEWGTLQGKPGDYVLKNYSDRDVAAPDDVWVVDQGLFKATYAPVAAPRPEASAGPT
jgi:hypothetical protein